MTDDKWSGLRRATERSEPLRGGTFIAKTSKVLRCCVSMQSYGSYAKSPGFMTRLDAKTLTP